MTDKRDKKLIEWGVVLKAYPGAKESGDNYLVEDSPATALIVAIDGLGHGDKAAAVSKKAVAALTGRLDQPVEHLMRQTHQTLKGSRGAVMSLASFDGLNDTMCWLGVGNVQGVLLRANQTDGASREGLMLRGGIVGYRLPTLRPVTVSVAPGDTLIFVSDGLRSNFTAGITLANSPQEIADYIFAHHGRGTDDALVLVVRYLGNKSSA